eukprot:CAMPEP_0206043046 /NCGR_PEP_ID=MMETSP1466-20131121/7538_1 /ASSEMBLY_ACC=CAM_ASM_001126 /TAXON_ID=44452 /ORGANISM="Pavlova gyrans, Strain CCMP608" /LENGTH=49 /DNA_ID= /DNA_START= /DNA_END= /DNA_ORIENTATION=
MSQSGDLGADAAALSFSSLREESLVAIPEPTLRRVREEAYPIVCRMVEL